MANENTFYPPVPVAVWGTGNMGRASIRAVAAHPGLSAGGGDRRPTRRRWAGTRASWRSSDRTTGRRSRRSDVDAALAALGGGGAVA